MDAGDRPTPPDDLDEDLRAFLAALGDEDGETIRSVAAYVDDLASWAERRDEHESESDAERPDDADSPADVPVPSGVPDTATVSVEEVAGTTYYYYQWREGDEIRSKTVTR
ncbi:hypothetical protein ACFO5R_07700 [Halosolutus amylolyticus]|uniref:Amphi-Trp domain-containing protein n=1 Tax=Halosolutus amylolyticus TaxID=2932267 RepID=A0ABD5PMR5_9EURY|nr:hypothetical protein [Halosolutus amylolyticus]